MVDTEPVWVWCSDCGPRSGMEFNAPDRVLCTKCGRQVGEPHEPIDRDVVALSQYYRYIINVDTGDPLSGVEWDIDRVEIKESND